MKPDLKFRMKNQLLYLALALLLTNSVSGFKYTTCNSASDCGKEGYWKCISVTEHPSSKVCEHKGVFPMYLNEFIGCFLIILTEIIANAGGTGGGGIIIPIIMIFFGFDTGQGVFISNFTVIFCALFRYIINFNQRCKLPGKEGRTLI
jgi:hypothetical protein